MPERRRRCACSSVEDRGAHAATAGAKRQTRSSQKRVLGLKVGSGSTHPGGLKCTLVFVSLNGVGRLCLAYTRFLLQKLLFACCFIVHLFLMLHTFCRKWSSAFVECKGIFSTLCE